MTAAAVVAAAAPQPEPEPEPPAPAPVASPAPAGALDLAALRELWPAVVDAVRAENVLAHAAVERARPVALDGGEVTLAFATGDSFYKKKAESEEHRGVIVAALRALSGQTLKVRCELREVTAEEAAPEAGGVVAVPTDDELVDRFVAAFDAEELIDDEEGA